MPRGPREIYENALLSVTARGNNKKIIFKKEKDYSYFKNLLLRYKDKFKFKIYHYCPMRNHFHIVPHAPNTISISRAMQGLQLAYFHYFRRRYGYVGRFWQGRFYSNIIEDDKYLLTAGLYIEANPVRAKIVKDPSEYGFSSYNVYANGIEDPLIDLDPFYLGLSDNNKKRQEIYRQMMEEYLSVENSSL